MAQTKNTKTITKKDSTDKKQPHISFQEYKRQATIEDLETMKQQMVPHRWEHIPIVGAIFYAIRMEVVNSGINRGPLRRQIVKLKVIFLFSMLFYFFVLVLMLTPTFIYKIHKMAVEKTQKLIDNDEL